jgi:hypothetical protein
MWREIWGEHRFDHSEILIFCFKLPYRTVTTSTKRHGKVEKETNIFVDRKAAGPTLFQQSKRGDGAGFESIEETGAVRLLPTR